MCRLLETIMVRDGLIIHPAVHLRRMHYSAMECFGSAGFPDSGQFLTVPPEASRGVWRCRIIYGREIETVGFIPYTPRQVRSLKIVTDDLLDYHLKFADRSRLDELFGKRGDCDDVIIAQHGRLTDTTIANLVFYDGTKWHTPAHPLLPGTQREWLLESRQIIESEITLSNYRSFQLAGMINTFNDLDNMQVIPVSQIFPPDHI